MRAKRKRFQEEVFSDPESNPSTIITRSSEPTNISILPTNISINDIQPEPQPELSENILESDLSFYESDKLNEYLPLFSHSPSDSVNSDIYKYFSHDSTKENNSEENIQLNLRQWSLTHNISHAALSDLLQLLKIRIPELLH